MWLHSYRVKSGGNFSGVCHGKDQAVRKKHLSQDNHANFWDFIFELFKTPECVLTCHGNFSSKYCYNGKNPNQNLKKEGKLQWQKQQL